MHNRTFIEAREFTKRWVELGFTEENLWELQNQIMENPLIGDLMKHTGGLRKMRIAFAGQGKSGSARVCYADFDSYETTHLITVFSKNEKENLSASERAIIKQMLSAISKELERKRK